MIIFQGGAPFEGPHDELDRAALDGRPASSVAVLPTADAMENPRLLVDAAEAWAARLGPLTAGPIAVDAVMVLQRAEATDEAAARLRAADAVYVVGDSPLHLRSAIKDTPVMAALAEQGSSGLVVAAGGSAAALCDPMTDPRGGAFALGLGLVSQLALVTECETWTADRLMRTRELAAELHEPCCLALLPTTSALELGASGWRRHGQVEVVGELPGTDVTGVVAAVSGDELPDPPV